MTLNIENVVRKLNSGFGIQKQRLYKPNDKWRQYRLLKSVKIELTKGETIYIPAGFEWDLSSVPKFLWIFFSPDGNFEIAALIHDFLYRHKLFSRKFADKEMLKWSMVLNSTKTKISFRHLDNVLRFCGVRLFGWSAWKK